MEIRGLVGRMFGRSTTEPRDPDEARFYSGRPLAGVKVDADTAITVPAVWACLRYLSQTVAVLPWHVMRDGARGGERAPTHPVDWLLWKRVSPEWSSSQFRETLTHWALRHGNGYAEIERDAISRPIAMHPLHPDRVEVCRALNAMEDSAGNPIAAGELYYEVSNGVGGKTDLRAMDMFHVRGFGEGPVGVNVIEYAAQSIGWARAAQLFGAAFFGNGMNIGGVVTTGKKGLSEGGLKRLKAEFAQLYKGVRNAMKTVFLDAEMEWKATQIDPEKGQFIATNQHLVEEICRWFGVPPHKVQHLMRATFSNIEHQAIEVVVDSISPWVKRFEDEADYKLFGRQNRLGFYTKMNMNALLRGDMKARMEFFGGMQRTGSLSPNDIRRLEDMPTLGPEGDIYVMQEQMVPISYVAARPEREAAAAEAALAPPEPTPEEDDAVVDAALQRIEGRLGVVAHVG